MPQRGLADIACRALWPALLLLALAGCSLAPVQPAQDEDPHPAVARREFRPQGLARIEAPEPAMDPEAIEPGDLFERIRAGFMLQDVDHPSVDREVDWYARHPDYLDRTFRRGERYLHYIVEELEARGMPLELALLPVVESAFNPVAYSRARASGLWQFIPATGLRYGLKQNWYYDGRRDVLESTRAALDYLTFLANEFDGDWLLAIAAYNTGEANVARRIAANRRAGRPTDFFNLPLHRETRAYVPKLLAMRRIVADPARHNLEFAAIPDRPYFDVVETDGQIELDVARELAGVPADEFLALNPGFRHGVTDPDGPHRLLVPRNARERLMAGLSTLPPEDRIRVINHRVRSGETLGAIARRYGVAVETIQAANRLRGTTIRVGQDLAITAAPARTAAARPAAPAPATPAPARSVTAAPVTQVADSTTARTRHTIRRGDTLWNIAQTHGVGLDALAAHNGLGRNSTLRIGQSIEIPPVATLAATGNATPNLQPVTYVVRAGDTLTRIARTFRVTLADLLSWNNLRSAHVLRPGQRLVMYLDEATRIGG